jgi:toxin ParE1/3/4
MTQVILSAVAQQDIRAILAWTQSEFGGNARLRYEALIIQAIRDIVTDPDRPGSLRRPELAAGARTYHLRYSRDHVAHRQERVHRPRHLLVFRVSSNLELHLARVLHDSMDLAQHLPPGYLPE